MKRAAKAANKEFMNVHPVSAPKRARLSLPFGRKARPEPAAIERRSATLSPLELRRLVAEMID